MSRRKGNAGKRTAGEVCFQRRRWKKSLAVALAAAIAFSQLTLTGEGKRMRGVQAAEAAEEGNHGLHNPVTDVDGITTWDCVYFGQYWQNDTNGDGKADQQDEKEPIKWRVLSVDGQSAYLLADKCLDRQPTPRLSADWHTWAASPLRKWLKNSFMKDAFSESEQTAIQKKVVSAVSVYNFSPPDDNYDMEEEYKEENYIVESEDQITLLSGQDAVNPEYGFRATKGSCDARKAKSTAYANANGLDWGTRDVLTKRIYDYSGYMPAYYANGEMIAIRPALYLDLSQVSEWSPAGTVDSTDFRWIETQTPAPDVPADRRPNPPQTDGETTTTWDCVYFGKYWQNDTNGDGVADEQDEKEAVKWRVLSVDGNDAYLLADRNLDIKSISGETTISELRSWLNETFLDTVFSAEEQAALIETVTTSPIQHAGENILRDKVSLLAYEDTNKTEYGFIDYSSKKAINTNYTNYIGEDEPGFGTGASYLLRDEKYDHTGWYMYCDEYGGSVEATELNGTYGIRPVLHIDLSSVSNWSYAGTVTTRENNPSEPEKPSASPMESPDVTENPSSTPSESPDVTTNPGEPSVSPSESPDVTGNPENPSASPKESPDVTTKPGEPSASPVNSQDAPKTPMVSRQPGQNANTAQVSAVPKPGRVSGLKLKAGKKKIQASWKKCKGAAGYELCYSTSKKWKNSKKLTVKKTKLTLKKLKKKKMYYVRVRAYTVQKGKKVYGVWTSRKTKVK